MARRKVEILGKGEFVKLVNDNSWEYADRVKGTGVVAIVAVTDKNELVLTEQYRYPVRMKVIDLPAGLSGDITGEEGEAQVRAARRELLEETGFRSKTMQFIGTCPTSPGLTSEMISLFLATSAEQIGAGGGVETESIKVHVVPLAKIHSWLQRKDSSRTCIDIKVYAALGLLARQ